MAYMTNVLNDNHQQGEKRFSSWQAFLVVTLSTLFAGLLFPAPLIGAAWHTTLFPAAGAAVAAAILMGPKSYLAIFLGITASQCGITYFVSPDSSNWETIFLYACLLGVACVIQANVTRHALQRFLRNYFALEEIGDIIRFMLIVGPAGSLLLPTFIAILQAWTFGTTDHITLANWAGHWIGITTSCVAITTIAFSFFAEPRKIWHRRRFTIAIPTLMIMFAVIAIEAHSHRDDLTSKHAELDNRTQSLSRSLAERVSFHSEILRSIANFYDASNFVDRDEFSTFVKNLIHQYKEIDSFQWIPKVTREQKEKFKELARKDGIQSFEILQFDKNGLPTKAADRALYFPIYYVEPLEGHEALLGRDVSSENEIQQLLLLAENTNDAVLSSPQGQNQFIQILPIFHHSLLDEESGKYGLLGFVIGKYHFDHFIKSAFKKQSIEDLHLRILDNSQNQPKEIFTINENPNRQEERPLLSCEKMASTHHACDITFQARNRSWVIQASRRTKPAIDSHPIMTNYFVLAGATLIILIDTLLLLLSGRASIIEKLVDQQTLELRQTNQELRIKSEELSQSNQELDDFAYIASHDLREPLRGIKSYANFLLEDYRERLDSDGTSKLETLSRLTQRLEGLLDSLLQYSRVGRTKLSMQPVNLQEMVEEVVDSLHISLKNSGTEVRIINSLPETYCDKARIGEIFRNLVTNSMKYNDKADKWIEIGTIENNEATDSKAPIFFVRDNGIGIREQHIGKVFQIFRRLHKKDEYGGGTGSGLTIVKKIVERHGGRIWVESTYGEGSTFFFTLTETETDA